MKEVRSLGAKSQSKPMSQDELEKDLRQAKDQYGFKTLALTKSGAQYHVHAAMNPEDDVDVSGTDFSADELTGESLWVETASRINAEEVPVGEGTRLSASSLSFNSTLLLGLMDASNQPPARKNAATALVALNLMRASQSTEEARICAYVNAAARAVNDLYTTTIATTPGRELQAHHRPGVKESSPTFPQTRAGRKRASVAQRIKNNVQNLTAEERAISLRPASARSALIREYVQQLLETEIGKRAEKGAGPVPEFDLDVMTTSAHLGGVHGRR